MSKDLDKLPFKSLPELFPVRMTDNEPGDKVTACWKKQP